MTGGTISHCKIVATGVPFARGCNFDSQNNRCAEPPQIAGQESERGPNYAKASLGRPVHRSPIKQSKGNR